MGEDILDAGEILIGIDLDGDELGEVSKCILMCIVYGVGLVVYVYTPSSYGRCRPESVLLGSTLYSACARFSVGR